MPAELLYPTAAPITPESRPSNQEMLAWNERIRLGGDEFAVCGAIDLNPDSESRVRLVVLDLGFRQTVDGQYGPYDIDGSGEKRTFKTPYVIVRRKQTEEGPKTFTFGFDPEDVSSVTIGRQFPSALALGFDDDKTISRKHASLSVDGNGNLRVNDLGSKNGTKARSPYDLVGETTTNYGYTLNIDEFVRRSGMGEHYTSQEEQLGFGKGEFAGRPIIARDTHINGGVYPVGGHNGEALVVDDKKYPEAMNKVYDEIITSLTQANPNRLTIGGLRARLKGKKNNEPSNTEAATQNALSNVLDNVMKTLKYDLDATNKMASGYKKIDIGVYIEEGVGVCRTQALLSAYVIERLISEGRLAGRVSVDRNIDHEVAGGHAWARFTNESGQVFIIDPAQAYVGPIEDTYSQSNLWDYRRSEDIVQQILSAD